MLHLLDDAIKAYLRAEVPLRSGDMDMVFQRPDKEWGAAVTRPTVNMFLWDVRRNSGAQESGIETVEENGKKVRRQPQPRVDCRYMVTAWAGDVRDEHQLLGAVLGAFLRHSEMPPVYLTGALATVRPYPSTRCHVSTARTPQTSGRPRAANCVRLSTSSSRPRSTRLRCRRSARRSHASNSRRSGRPTRSRERPSSAKVYGQSRRSRIRPSG